MRRMRRWLFRRGACRSFTIPDGANHCAPTGSGKAQVKALTCQICFLNKNHYDAPAIAPLGLNTTTPFYLRRFNVKLSEYRAQWAFSPLNEVLAGMVGTFALIPEVIAFSYVSGVSPAISLYASFVISIAIALTGGRPGMISGAAGSIAFVVGALVHHHGVQYMFAATMLAGFMQLCFGLLRLHVVMRFVSDEVRTGFVNALAILIFSAQVPQMLHVTWHTYALIAIGLAIIYLVPRLFTAIPSPLICIIVLTLITIFYPMPVRTVADLGALPSGLPQLTWPHVPFNIETLEIIFPTRWPSPLSACLSRS
ncbi:hypothetical protein DOFOFD_01795 [Acetobacteraceae bacterium EV16P]|uniref:SLC26A/SulP transporter domain-containing protein n=1 Tax=Sorlinia euscelidii TaxID=3081148 RepID=A0ABU7U1L6_9PROT